MHLPEFLHEADGEIRLAGHRIGLYHVIDRYTEGYTAEMLREEFPSLPLDLIGRVIAFYHNHKAEVDTYVTEYRAELDRQEAATPRTIDWEELRRRFEAMPGGEKK
jgi:uncharacterized protein (DUF433 family)